jgi:hypothetical protein
MRGFALIMAAMAFASSALAAGVDSHTYTCVGLQSLIQLNRFVFINNPTFDDFVVVDHSYCSGSGSDIIQRRTVPTADNPECIVNYCKDIGGGN